MKTGKQEIRESEDMRARKEQADRCYCLINGKKIKYCDFFYYFEFYGNFIKIYDSSLQFPIYSHRFVI